MSAAPGRGQSDPSLPPERGQPDPAPGAEGAPHPGTAHLAALRRGPASGAQGRPSCRRPRDAEALPGTARPSPLPGELSPSALNIRGCPAPPAHRPPASLFGGLFPRPSRLPISSSWPRTRVLASLPRSGPCRLTLVCRAAASPRPPGSSAGACRPRPAPAALPEGTPAGSGGPCSLHAPRSAEGLLGGEVWTAPHLTAQRSVLFSMLSRALSTPEESAVDFTVEARGIPRGEPISASGLRSCGRRDPAPRSCAASPTTCWQVRPCLSRVRHSMCCCSPRLPGFWPRLLPAARCRSDSGFCGSILL